MLNVPIRDETQPTVIAEGCDDAYVVLVDEPMTMAEAMATVKRIQSRAKTKFVIYQPDSTVWLYR